MKGMIHSSQLVRINSLVPGEPDLYGNAGGLLSAVRIIGHEEETRDTRFRVGLVSRVLLTPPALY